MNPDLKRLVRSGSYVVDPTRVAEAMLSRDDVAGEPIMATRPLVRRSAVLVALERDGFAVRPEQRRPRPRPHTA